MTELRLDELTVPRLELFNELATELVTELFIELATELLTELFIELATALEAAPTTP